MILSNELLDEGICYVKELVKYFVDTQVQSHGKTRNEKDITTQESSYKTLLSSYKTINLSDEELPPEGINTTWDVYILLLYHPIDHYTKSLSLDPHKVTLSHTPHSYYNKDGVCVNDTHKKCLSSKQSFNDQDIYCPGFLYCGDWSYSS